MSPWADGDALTPDNLNNKGSGGIFNVMAYDAVGDGVANDTAAIQAAITAAASAGGIVEIPAGTYKSNALTLSNGIRGIRGPGTIIQRTLNQNGLVLASLTDVTIDGVSFIGIGGDFDASSNNAIDATSCGRLRIINTYMEGWRFHGMFLKNCTDVTIYGNVSYNLSHSIVRLQGCRRVTVSDNIANSTQLTDFKIALALESRNGHTYGDCEDVTISGNVISNYGDAQGIHGHTGIRVTVTGNVVTGTYMPISFNQYGADDGMEDVSIVGNHCSCPETGVDNSTSFGIFVGGGVEMSAKGVTITGNTVRYGNRQTTNNNEGGIGIGYVDRVTIIGNTLENCYYGGILLNGGTTAAVVMGNVIYNTITAAGEANAINVNGVTSGIIRGNILSTATHGVRLDAACPDLVVEDNLTLALTTAYVNINNAVVNGRIAYTAADTTPSVKNARWMTIANAGPISITTLDDGVIGQDITLFFDDANTTIVRTGNFKLVGAANYVSAQYGVLRVTYNGVVWSEVSRQNTAS